jgi:hypothetical protein
MKRVLLAAVIGLGVLGAGAATTQPYYPPIPPPRYEAVPPPPGEHYAWRPGGWHWNGYRYVWHRGGYVIRYNQPTEWVPGGWVPGPGPRGYVWAPAHWR